MQVVLFHDTWTDYYLPSIGIAAVRLLEAAGYEVILAEKQSCCGRPMFSAGLLDRARALARQNISALEPYARAGIPIVGCEPSCILTICDEYTALRADEPTRDAARVIAENTFLLESFLRRELDAGRISLPFTDRRKTLRYHGHCYQKAMIGTGDAVAMLARPPGYEVREIPSGCCGMAGSFGYEAEHYEVSRLVGEQRLFPAIRDALGVDGWPTSFSGDPKGSASSEVGNTNSTTQFVSPTAEAMGHPTESSRNAKDGWPTSLEVGNTNSTTQFASPTAEAMGHPEESAGHAPRAPVEIVVSGFSCRHQVAHHTDARPRHLLEVLADAL